MLFLRPALAVSLALAPLAAVAQSDTPPPSLMIELNTLQDVGAACRLTFVVENHTGAGIETASFETVIFDQSGAVHSLSLFTFRDLPADRPRVRQFDLPGIGCDVVGKALINGANSCVVDGADSPVCHDALTLSSRTDVELIG